MLVHNVFFPASCKLNSPHTRTHTHQFLAYIHKHRHPFRCYKVCTHTNTYVKWLCDFPLENRAIRTHAFFCRWLQSKLAVFYIHAATQTQTQSTSALRASAVQTERASERKRMRIYIWEIHNTTIGVLSIQLVLVEQRKDNVKHTALPVHTAHSTEAHNQTANKCGRKKN